MLRQLLYTGECSALSRGRGFFKIRSVIRAEYRGNIAGGRNGGEVINVDDSDSDSDEARANGRVVAEDASSEDGQERRREQPNLYNIKNLNIFFKYNFFFRRKT